MNAKEISRLLAQRAEDVAKYLFPNGKRSSNEWRIGSISGEAGQSLAIHLTGEKAGVWCDFEKGDGGDLLDLWSVKHNCTLMEAIKDAARYLGIAQPKFEAYKPKNFVKPKSKILSSLNDSSAVMTYLTQERKLTKETIHAFKISEQDKKIVFPYYRQDELVFIKYLAINRFNGKKQISVEANCEPSLFGWHLG